MACILYLYCFCTLRKICTCIRTKMCKWVFYMKNKFVSTLSFITFCAFHSILRISIICNLFDPKYTTVVHSICWTINKKILQCSGKRGLHSISIVVIMYSITIIFQLQYSIIQLHNSLKKENKKNLFQNKKKFTIHGYY